MVLQDTAQISLEKNTFYSKMKLRPLAIAIATTSLCYFVFHSLGGGPLVKSTPDDTTSCLTDLNNFNTIDTMFDEIILDPKTILYWTPFYGAHDYGFGLGQQAFISHKCDVFNCVATSNRSTASNADAIVFHLIDHLKMPKLPPVRKSHQRYVFFFMEPPQKINSELAHSLKKYNDVFNLTMTYRTDSSVYNPFSTFIRRKVPAPKILVRARKVLKFKTKMVAWFAECDEDPLAKSYVEELKKYVRVDVYGPCGNLKCGPLQSSTCWDMVEKDYRFILAAEAFMCKDYITVRSFRALDHHILPLVYGGANYTRSTPPNSVVNIFDYPSPKALADYIQKLEKNDEAYMWHMEWKKDWELGSWGQGFCDLCKIINTPKYPPSTIRDLPEFLTPKQCGRDYLSHFKPHWTGSG